MNAARTRTGRKTTASLYLLLSAVVAVLLSACGSAGSSPNSTASSGSVAASGTPVSVARTSGAACGTLPSNPPTDPSRLVSTLPAANQGAYANYPFPVAPSQWANLPAQTGKIKIGVMTLPLVNAFGNDTMKQAQADASHAGVQLEESALPSLATMSPAEQISDYEALVRSGVKGIMVIPLSGPALAPAVTAAAKQGVVTVAINGHIPSPAAINVILNPYTQGMVPTATTLKLIGASGNILQVRGIPGETNDAIVTAATQKLLANCPNVKLAGSVTGGYNNPGAKAAVLQFLATHPQKISAVVQDGTMASGIISAFQQFGRPVPVVSDAGAQLGSLAYWLDNRGKGYNGTGTAGNGFQLTDAAFRVLMRTLAGRGPKLTDMVISPLVVTNANVARFTRPGTSLSDPAEVLGTPQLLASDSYLDGFFNKPDNPPGVSTVVVNQ